MNEKLYSPVLRKCRGKWLNHKILEPGILEHEAENGDKFYTVRCSIYSSLSILNIREICELADKYCDGELNFTSGNDVEFILTSQEKVGALKGELGERRFKNGECKFPLRVLAPALAKFKRAHFV
ncbi:MAG: hypothetical protein LBB66_00500 [Desulfovibrio sp.]|jgi:sulfite reductase beta subunit|nr:hypothetical protein [Desulfovibrio sp.]